MNCEPGTWNHFSYLLAEQNRSLGGTTGANRPAPTTIGHKKVMTTLLAPDPGHAVFRNTAIQKGIDGFLEHGYKPSEALKKELREHVTRVIGALARPDEIRFTDLLPKTRSGKIMRRLLKEVASGGQIKGDTTTLEDMSVLAKLSQEEEE